MSNLDIIELDKVSNDANSIKDDIFIKNEIEHYKKENNYNNYVHNENIELYDKDFVDFYHNGKIIIGDKEYNTSDLYLETGESNREKQLFLIYYKYPNNDILSKKEKKDFKRISVMSFRNSFVFYQIYNKYKNEINESKLIINNIDDICNIIQKFDGKVHLETPETSYNRVRPRNNKE